MRQSKLHIKTRKEAPSDEVSKNAILLTRAGYIYKEMAGVYALLPLGLRVLRKIEDIIRFHMDTVASEVLLPSLSPIERWQATGRLDTIDVLMKTIPANKASEEKSSNSYILNPTHEDVLTPIVKENARSYRDLPVALYQIQTKFRNEARAKSGMLRGREFRMKDLYSFHKDQDDLMKFYDSMKEVYARVYADLGIGNDTYLTVASGGDFTPNFSHEFQTLTDAGEDIIYVDRKNKIAYNKEVATPENETKLGISFDTLEQCKASEVGNIFPLDTRFSKALDYTYTDEHGEQQIIYMGSYGIGPSRLMGVITEKLADDKGLVWPASIAPFSVHLIVISKDTASDTYKEAENLYTTLSSSGVEVLFDDREVQAGEKFADSDLIGIPMRVVVSDKSLKQGGVEVKERISDISEIVSINQCIDMFTKVCL